MYCLNAFKNNASYFNIEQIANSINDKNELSILYMNCKRLYANIT